MADGVVLVLVSRSIKRKRKQIVWTANKVKQ